MIFFNFMLRIKFCINLPAFLFFHFPILLSSIYVTEYHGKYQKNAGKISVRCS